MEKYFRLNHENLNYQIYSLAKNIVNNDKSKITVKKIKTKNKLNKHIGNDYNVIKINNSRYCKEFKKKTFVPLKKGIQKLTKWIKLNQN